MFKEFIKRSRKLKNNARCQVQPPLPGQALINPHPETVLGSPENRLSPEYQTGERGQKAAGNYLAASFF